MSFDENETTSNIYPRIKGGQRIQFVVIRWPSFYSWNYFFETDLLKSLIVAWLY